MEVRVRAAAPPQETTSRAASAMWGSSFAGPADDVRRWAGRGLAELRALAGEPPAACTSRAGCSPRAHRGRGPPALCSRASTSCAATTRPPGFAAAFASRSPSSTCRVTSTTCSRASRRRAALEIGALGALADVAGAAPVVVNCSGVGARELVPDPTVRAVRGQHVVVENPGLEEFFMEEPAPRWAGWFPTATTSSSAAAPTSDDWRLDPDPAIAEEIVRRCAAIEPRLAGARVIEQRVGLGPARPEVRVEEERAGRRRAACTTTGTAAPAWRWPGAARATSRRSSRAHEPPVASRRPPRAGSAASLAARAARQRQADGPRRGRPPPRRPTAPARSRRRRPAAR